MGSISTATTLLRPPDMPRELDDPSLGALDPLLHPKYLLPARCFAYVGNAAAPRTWKLPYRNHDDTVDTKRLPKAINAVLKTYRGERVSIPEAAVPDVLIRLAVAAKSVGRFDVAGAPSATDCYSLLTLALDQLGRLGEV